MGTGWRHKVKQGKRGKGTFAMFRAAFILLGRGGKNKDYQPGYFATTHGINPLLTRSITPELLRREPDALDL